MACGMKYDTGTCRDQRKDLADYTKRRCGRTGRPPQVQVLAEIDAITQRVLNGGWIGAGELILFRGGRMPQVLNKNISGCLIALHHAMTFAMGFHTDCSA